MAMSAEHAYKKYNYCVFVYIEIFFECRREDLNKLCTSCFITKYVFPTHYEIV